jgi:hypothetical protein
MGEQRAAEIQFAIHWLMQAVLDVLGEDLAEDYLFSEILGADGDAVLRGTTREQQNRG